MIIIKIGGSLTKDKEVLENLCREIENLSADFDFVIIPGGGEFADIVRIYDKKFNLAPGISHKMAILAMDQTGLLISSFFYCSVNDKKYRDFRVYEEISRRQSHKVYSGISCRNSDIISKFSARKFYYYEKPMPIFNEQDKIKILIPSRFLFDIPETEIKPSWDITSDSIAAYVAGKLRAEKLIILTDVDGIYDSDPDKNRNAKLIKKINIRELVNFGEACIDKKFHEFLKTDCAVINGKFPERISDVVEGREFIGTEILV
ncbi:MAG: hypothetical protein CVT90_01515 [Candidatus Altiarchaeales archaeon HGW-Altiarchaeales-3]|nr:MAG: hypothetical protein CVT90_01515 [Candidatus Altiarchaeales archaeon HGW-Altiarchaeales-3]